MRKIIKWIKKNICIGFVHSIDYFSISIYRDYLYKIGFMFVIFRRGIDITLFK